jgi:3-oxoadipate enol-lactonase
MPLHRGLIHYEVVPNVLPESAVFVHGNLASNRWWYPAKKIWRQKAQGRDFKGSMILVEFRGCGKSAAPKSDDEIDMHLFASDFNSLIEEMNWGPVHVIGHSTGGFIAALMLEKSPQLFRKAVLLDPVGATGVKIPELLYDAYERMKTSRAVVSTVIGATIYRNNPDSEFFEQIVEDAYRAVQTVGMGVVKALDGVDIRSECSRITHPVLVLHGEHDSLLPVADSKAMASLMKNSKFQIIPGQGHCANAENPGAFVELVDSFAFCH